MHSGERQAAKMRMAYLKAMLNQDISLFDTESSTGEVISAITTDIIVVQDAISEKVNYERFLVSLSLSSASPPPPLSMLIKFWHQQNSSRRPSINYRTRL